MSGNPRIRIRSTDIAEIERLNKSISNKKSRLRTKFGVEVAIERKTPEDFSTRKEYNSWKKEVLQFTNRKSHRYVKNEHNVVFPYEAIKEMEKEVRRVNRIKEKNLKKYSNETFKDRGQGTALTVQQTKTEMGDSRFDSFRPLHFNINRFESSKEFDQYRDKFGKTYDGDFIAKRNELYRDNYLKALDNAFGEAGKDIRQHVKSMKLADFIKLYYTENLADIKYIYDFLEMQAKIQDIKGVYGI